MDQDIAKPMPGTAVALGVLWLLAAAGLFAYGACLILMLGVIDRFTPGGLTDMPQAPPEAYPFYWALQHYLISGGALLLLGALGICSGIQFLRRRPWARSALEIGAWAAVALAIACAALASPFWVAHGRPLARALSMLVALRIAALLGALPVVFLVLLRGRSVRAAFPPTRHD